MIFPHLLTNDRGLTMVELLVACAVGGIVALGGTHLLKMMGSNQANFNNKVSAISMSKMIDAHMNSPEGCGSIIGKEIDDDIEVKVGGTTLVKGAVVGGVKIEALRVDKFFPTDKNKENGVAEIIIILNSPGSSRPSVSKVLIPVSVKPTSDYNLEIQNCTGKNTQPTKVVADKLCRGAFGFMIDEMDCSDVMDQLEKITARAVCKDLYGGADKAKFDGIHCDLSGIHKNIFCPTGKSLMGFNERGGFLCKDTPRPGENVFECKEWSRFSPEQDSKCPNEGFVQTRVCLDKNAPTSISESRIVNGKKSEGCDSGIQCRPPLQWISETGDVCMADDPNETYLAPKDSPQSAKGRRGTYQIQDKMFHNSGEITFYCENNSPVVTTSECMKVTGANQ